jgi:protein SCO1/2
MMSSSRALLNEAKKGEEEKVVEGVRDPGTATHGYDPLKPRKPLSRIALGGDSKNIDHGKGKRQSAQGLFNWKPALLFLVTGGALTYYFVQEKKRIDMQRESEAHKGIGKPKVGGPFNLVDQNGKPFSDQDLLGKWSLIYFGFSMCPDICPDELDKMSEMLDAINTRDNKILTPVFITCDPHRDSPEVLKRYLDEFHPDIIGLTGSYDDIKQTCKHYRVYFSTPPDLKPGQDYLVDHSIFFYLMDPEGKFVDALGRNYTAEEATSIVKSHMHEWRPAAQRQQEGDSKKSFLERLITKS